MDTRRAPEGQQRKAARVDAAPDRDQPDPFRHVGIDDAVNALGRRRAVDTQPRGDRVHRDGGGLHVEPLPAAQEARWVEEPEHQVGVGDGRRSSTASITGGPRARTGAGGPDVQHAAGVDVRDRAAARADSRDVEAVQGDPVARDPVDAQGAGKQLQAG